MGQNKRKDDIRKREKSQSHLGVVAGDDGVIDPIRFSLLRECVSNVRSQYS